MSNYTEIKDYANSLGQGLNKISLESFFKNICHRFYSEMDISFMSYFLEIIEEDGKFVIPHSKLLEYGVMTSQRSSDVKDKLVNLGMKERADYLLRNIPQQSDSSRGIKHLKVYYLTPKSFKKCLMRAKKHGQSIDPTIYCDYFLLLDSIYQKSYDDKVR